MATPDRKPTPPPLLTQAQHRLHREGLLPCLAMLLLVLAAGTLVIIRAHAGPVGVTMMLVASMVLVLLSGVQAIRGARTLPTRDARLERMSSTLGTLFPMWMAILGLLEVIASLL